MLITFRFFFITILDHLCKIGIFNPGRKERAFVRVKVIMVTQDQSCRFAYIVDDLKSGLTGRFKSLFPPISLEIGNLSIGN